MAHNTSAVNEQGEERNIRNCFEAGKNCILGGLSSLTFNEADQQNDDGTQTSCFIRRQTSLPQQEIWKEIETEWSFRTVKIG